MTGPIFVDSNVLIYVRDSADPVKQSRAREWMIYLWHENLGRTSMQVLCEFYVNVTRKLVRPISSSDAWQEVESLLAWRPQPIDENLLQGARDVAERWRLNWWDAMIVAAAQMQDCTLLLSEDLQDGAMFGSVTVRSPFTTRINEALETYSAQPAAAPRHRPRGRPPQRLVEA